MHFLSSQGGIQCLCDLCSCRSCCRAADVNSGLAERVPPSLFLSPRGVLGPMIFRPCSKTLVEVLPVVPCPSLQTQWDVFQSLCMLHMTLEAMHKNLGTSGAGRSISLFVNRMGRVQKPTFYT
eukprot:395548-Pelagomonas_calceolata.AAC.5